MKKNYLVSGLVAAMFIAFSGCNDAVDNGVFVDNGAFEERTPIVSQTAEEETASMEMPVMDAQDYPRIRRVETYGATCLWNLYAVLLWIWEYNRWDGTIMTEGGRLWAHTYNDIPSWITPGTLLCVSVEALGLPMYLNFDPHTGYCVYDPNGGVLTFDVTSDWSANMYIDDVKIYYPR
jgi:hypothetical protein